MKEVGKDEMEAAIAALNKIQMPNGEYLVFADTDLAVKHMNGWSGELVLRRKIEFRVKVSDIVGDATKNHNVDITFYVDNKPIFTTSEGYPSLLSRIMYVIEHLNDLLTEGIRLGFCEADRFEEIFQNQNKKVISQLEDHLDGVGKRSKARLKIISPRKLSQARKSVVRAKILHDYEKLCEICPPIKTLHDLSYKEFCRGKKRHTRDEWSVAWREIAKAIYPDLPEQLLDYFSQPEAAPVSVIAQSFIADKLNYSRSYVEKLLGKARKEKDSLPYYDALNK